MFFSESGTEDKIYESIRLPTLQDHNAKNDNGDSESDNETESELTAHERLPKGERYSDCLISVHI